MDTAKAIGVGVPYDGDFWDFFSTETSRMPATTLPVGCVVTIAATGSEGSNNTVITLEPDNLKWGNKPSDLYRPKFAVMNPRFTCSVPAYQTASGATDMISHVLERYFTNTTDVALTDRLGEAIIRTVLDATPRALSNPNDMAARSDLMWAGTLAHNDICGTGRQQDWGSHQIEHELSAFYDCAHGAGLAVIQPAWMEYVLPHDPMRFAQCAQRVFGCEMNFAHPEETGREGIWLLRKVFHSWGMPTSFGELGAKEEDIPAIVAHRAEKPHGYPIGNFIKMGPQEVEAVLRIAAAQKPAV